MPTGQNAILYNGPMNQAGWGGSGGWNGESSIGGVSAVNPQAQGNYQQYQDAAFANAKQRLDPILGQQRDAYAQQMVNMGLPVGGEAYNKAFQQLDQNQNDAWSNAAFNAMQFGAQMQNQDFTQDATRAGLANALLQSRWNTDLGYAGIDADKYIADMQNAFNYANLGEQGRQFDLGLGFDYSTLGENARQFNDTLGFNYTDLLGNLGLNYSRLGEDARQFDDTLGLNYADLFSGLYKFDNTMDFNYFNADREDMRWLTELGYDAYNDQISNNQWSDALGQNLINPYDPTPLNTSPVTDNYRNQWSQYAADSLNNNQWWQNLANLYASNSDLWS